ncbi:hypothetical protein [Streptomyces sp. NPDC051561]|uniref:hypothetical protein n=1 Tax=Streptomyces sp. NPDC051561 TaxID=3365658 RepID=UPI0037B07126
MTRIRTRTRSAPRSPLVLLAAGVLLAVLGVFLLAEPAPPQPVPRPPAVLSPTPRGPEDGATARLGPARSGLGPAQQSAADPVPDAPAGRPNALPVSGEGPRGDPAIQKAVRAAVPDDLPPDTGQVLAQLGKAVQIAETTGQGRHLWPAYFPPDQPVRAYTRVRIQASAARADGPGRALVHLVWAGADPAGTYRDGRPATLRFQHTPPHPDKKTTATTEGDVWTSWIPTR